jgi:hypothetical protein
MNSPSVAQALPFTAGYTIHMNFVCSDVVILYVVFIEDIHFFLLSRRYYR